MSALLAPDALAALLEQGAATTPDEVVTHALGRDVVLPHGAGTAVLVTLDNGLDHRRPNTFGARGLAELDAALDAALARDDVVAVAITGKPFVLAAGADLSAIPRMTDRDQALAIARAGHAVFDRLHTAAVPTFVFVNGLALGGGFELALHARYRTVSAAAAGLGLPECFLGIVPAWGGCYLLPNLVGAERALKVIIENPLSANRMLTGPQYAALGVADVLLDGADFLERSLEWAARVVVGDVVVDRPEPDRGEAWDAAVAAARALVETKVAHAAPAPYCALELVALARTADRSEVFTAEDEALADLVMSPELRSGLYAFDLVQKRARRPAGAPDKALARPVAKVGVVGAGLMASQLALLFLRRLRVPVVVSDLDPARVDRAVAGIRAEIDTLLARRRVSPDEANRLRALISGTVWEPSGDLSAYAGCSVVIEAVFEELEVKRQVFAELERHVGPETVLATNTSSLSVAAMAEGLEHPERVVGFHFFNPVAVLPLVEVVRAPATDDATVATAVELAKALRKNAVLVADAPGFVVNRVLLRFMGEVMGAVDEGTPVEVADAALAPLGLPMSTFALLQLVGPAVALHVAETLHAGLGERFVVSPNLRALVESGRPGLYDRRPDGTPYVSDETAGLLSVGDAPSTAEQVRERVLTAVTEEIDAMLEEGVVSAPMDVDLCLVLGAGWPFHLGGITPYLDRSGYAERVLGHRFLSPGVASVPA